MAGERTVVSVSWRKKRRNHRVLFGTPLYSIRLDWQRKLDVFSPGQIFAYERWRANKYGTIEWQVFILKARHKGDLLDDITGVRPGAIILLSAHGRPAVKRLMQALDKLRREERIEHLSEEFWGRLNCLIAAGFMPDFAVSTSLAS